jgi:hypothetical protein
LNEYQSKEVTRAEALYSTIIATGIKCTLLFAVNVEDGKYYFDTYAIFLNDCPDGLNLQINKREYDKQYRIFTYNQYELDFSCKKAIQSTLKEPQNIGVLTPKKVAQWEAYYIQLHALYLAKIAEINGKIEAFISEVKEYEKTCTPLTKYDTTSNGVRWYNDGLSGWIKNNGLEFQFECNTKTGYIRKEIRVIAEDRELSTFIKLSDNKY